MVVVVVCVIIFLCPRCVVRKTKKTDCDVAIIDVIEGIGDSVRVYPFSLLFTEKRGGTNPTKHNSKRQDRPLMLWWTIFPIPKRLGIQQIKVRLRQL